MAVTTDNVKGTLISAMVQSYLSENSILIPSIMDRSGEITTGLKQLDIGRAGSIAAEDFNGTSWTDQSLTWEIDTLEINKRAGSYVTIKIKDDVQSAVNQEPQLLNRMIASLVGKLEEEVYAEIASVNAANKFQFKAGATISYQDITHARKILTKQYVPLQDRVLAINPEQEEQLCDMESFYHADKYGSRDVLLNGEIGRIAGFRVLVSNSVAENNAVFYHNSHGVFARQLEVEYESDRILKSDVIEHKVATLYGLKVLDSGKRGVLINEAGV